MDRKNTVLVGFPNRAAHAEIDIVAYASEAFESGRFDVCDAYLTALEPHSREQRGAIALVRARLERRRWNVDAWLEAASYAEIDHPEKAGRLEGAALKAAAERRRGDDRAADSTFARVHRQLETSRPVAAATYLLAVDAWERRDGEAAERLIAPFLSGPNIDAPCMSLSGWILIRRERYKEAGRRFAAAMDLAVKTGDNFTLVHSVAQYVNIAAETADLKAGLRARRAYEKATWGPSFGTVQYQALIGLRHLAMLSGDASAAWFYARQSFGLARNPSAVVKCDIDGSVASRLIGDRQAQLLQLERAWKNIRAERWGEASEEERIALSDFAAEAATAMPAAARQAITMYRSLRAKQRPQEVLDADVRVEAFSAFAEARVDAAGGDRAAAIAKYEHALACYEKLGLNLRIAIVANDLWKLTRINSYRDRLQSALEGAPDAWLLRSLGNAENLGAKAREVLALLLEGNNTKTIAVYLGRSRSTVDEHVRRICATFGVHSRDELRSRCSDLNIRAVDLREF